MMEEKKRFAPKANMSSARSEYEAEQIKICNAAMIEVAKTVNKYRICMSDTDWEDAIGDACLRALTYVKPGCRGAIAYSEKCGMTNAIMAGKKYAEDKNRFSCFDDKSNGIRMMAYAVKSDDEPEREFERIENDERIECLKRCVNNLPEAERLLVQMCVDKIPYKAIAKRLGCNEATARKRMHDTRIKVIRMMAA